MSTRAERSQVNKTVKVLILVGELVALACFCALTACSSAKHNPGESAKQKPATADKAVSPITRKDVAAAEALVDEGETLARPRTIDAAYGKFNEALQLDPDNDRAKFWRAVTNLTLKLKGIIGRVRPAYIRSAGPERYAKFVQAATKGMDINYASFMRDGPQDIQTAEELQDWMDQLNASMFELRTVLRGLRDKEFSITVNSQLVPNYSPNLQECTPLVFGPIHVPDSFCDQKSRDGEMQVALSRADFEALLIFTSVYQVHLELWTAYRIDPLAFMSLDERKTNTRAQAEEVMKRLFAVERAGELRHKRPFAGSIEITKDVATSLHYLLDNQKQVCPTGYYSLSNRRGYLLPFGTCFAQGSLSRDSAEQRTVNTIEAFLTGGLVNGVTSDVDVNTGADIEKPFELRASDLVSKPIKNLTEIQPRFDACGKVIGFKTNALDRYFTLSSATELLDASARKNPCPQQLGGAQ